MAACQWDLNSPTVLPPILALSGALAGGFVTFAVEAPKTVAVMSAAAVGGFGYFMGKGITGKDEKDTDLAAGIISAYIPAAMILGLGNDTTIYVAAAAGAAGGYTFLRRFIVPFLDPSSVVVDAIETAVGVVETVLTAILCRVDPKHVSGPGKGPGGRQPWNTPAAYALAKKVGQSGPIAGCHGWTKSAFATEWVARNVQPGQRVWAPKITSALETYMQKPSGPAATQAFGFRDEFFVNENAATGRGECTTTAECAAKNVACENLSIPSMTTMLGLRCNAVPTIAKGLYAPFAPEWKDFIGAGGILEKIYNGPP